MLSMFQIYAQAPDRSMRAQPAASRFIDTSIDEHSDGLEKITSQFQQPRLKLIVSRGRCNCMDVLQTAKHSKPLHSGSLANLLSHAHAKCTSSQPGFEF